MGLILEVDMQFYKLESTAKGTKQRRKIKKHL